MSLCLAAPLHAQEARPVAFSRFSTQHGLSNYSVTSILQDQRGFLWIGTQGGLNRYDGYAFVQYRSDNSPLADDFIHTLLEDHRGVIWIGTQSAGVQAFDPATEQFTAFSHDRENPRSLSHNDVQALFEDRAGNLWVGTRGGGLNRFDRDSGGFTRFTSDVGDAQSLASDTVWALHESASLPGVLWVGTEAGLQRLRYAEDSWGPTHNPANDTLVIRDVVWALHSDVSGRLWIGTQRSGIYRHDPHAGSMENFAHDPVDPAGLGSNSVLAVHEDPTGAIWIGTYGGGLSHLDPVSGRMTRHQNVAGDVESLPHDEVHAVLMDRGGVLWVGTWGGLAKHVPSRGFIDYHSHDADDSNSLSHPWVSSIYEDRSGALWVGTLGGGLNRLDRQANRFTRFDLPFTDVIAMCEDEAGSLWLGTRSNRLYRFDRGTGIVTGFPLDPEGGGEADDVVVTIYESPSEPGVLWIGTRRRGLYTFDVRTLTVTANHRYDPTDDSSLRHNYAWPIHEDWTGTLWVGTWGGGLNRFDRTTRTFVQYVPDENDPNSISGDRVVSIEEDRDGTLWFGTFGNGLNRFDRATGRFTRYTTVHGLPDNDVLGILADEHGFMWLSTNDGLSRFDPRTETFVNLGVADGLQSSVFTIGARHRNARGELFFGGENGFNVVRPHGALDPWQPPPVILTSFHLFDAPARLDSSAFALREVKLGHDANYVAFEFAVLDFADPDRNRYAYMLEGVDGDWIEAENYRYVRYPRLSPGMYTFRVRGASANNVWNESGAALRLVINPPWWRTWWAYSLYLGAFLAVAFGSYKWRVRRLQQHALELRRRVDEATENLRAEKRKTEEQAERLLELEQVKDRFFANISHEFRTPLTLILGPVIDALDGAYGPLSPRLRGQLETMHVSGERLHRLINELLDLSKIEIGRMRLRTRERDLVSFVDDVVLSFLSLAERRRIALKSHAELEQLPVYFDSDKLEKILSNLLSNALKFTPEQGKVWVTVHEVEDETGKGNDRRFAEIRVKDTGRGISADELPYIFDRFYQVDTSSTREHAGTGIGLSLTKELVELHGGSIRVESEPGFGSSFFVRLPLGREHLGQDDVTVDDEAPEVDVSPPVPGKAVSYGTTKDVVSDASYEDKDPTDAEGPEASAPTILIVEDNADLRAYLKTHLSSIYHVAEASDGVDGLAKAREILPDLVISDVMMPKMDGMTLCRSLKEDEQLNHIPVILLTAKATDDSAIEGLTIGADDYVYKPFNAEVLMARVENLIAVRRILRRRFSEEIRIGPGDVTVPSQEAAFLQQVRDVVENHMGDANFGVDWFADEIGMSRRHLHRRLRELTDLSPAAYIRMMRLERAAQLLERRAGSVAEVAYRVGFRNADHFSRLFQQVFDVPPSRYPAE